jgi:hypothetical protein
MFKKDRRRRVESKNYRRAPSQDKRGLKSETLTARAVFSRCQMNKAEFVAFQECIANCTVGILTDDGRGVGTGTLVSSGPKRFILTADHVLNGSDPSKLRFILRPEGSLQEAPLGRIAAPHPGYVLSGGPIKPGNIVRDTANDIAALSLDFEQRLQGAAAFHEVPLVTDPRIEEGTSIILHGFAVGTAVQVGPTSQAVSAVAGHVRYDSTLNNLRFLPSCYDPEQQFLMKYELGKDGILPHGLSGAGTLCSQARPSGIWRANPVLVGVITGYVKKYQVLMVANLQSVLKLLSGF